MHAIKQIKLSRGSIEHITYKCKHVAVCLCRVHSYTRAHVDAHSSTCAEIQLYSMSITHYFGE